MVEVLKFGYGNYMAAEGTFNDKLAFIVTQDGTGVVGEEGVFDGSEVDPDTIKALFTFANRESVDVMIDVLIRLRRNF